jgi:hypothetical protein
MMWFNPLNIDAASGTQLACIYIVTLAMVCGSFALVLRIGRGAPSRRSWARRNKAAAVGVVLALWIGTLYGGSKGGTNQPPVTPPVQVYIERLIYLPELERFVPVWTPLRRIDP